MTFADIAAPAEAAPTLATAQLMLRLAQDALDAGQAGNAISYVDIAYAIFDSYVARLNASRRNAGRT